MQGTETSKGEPNSRAPSRLTACALAVLVAYSLALFAAELVGGETLARHLCGDIVGPTRFQSVNTTVSVFLLAGAAVLMVFTLATRPMDRRERSYFRIQAGVFGWLALDDRFLVHESIGEWLAIDDAFLLLAIGFLQLGLLFGLARLRERSARARRLLVGAAVMFAVMFVIDALQASFPWPGRLTTEDLAKTLSAACLFGFVWSVCSAPLGSEDLGGPPGVLVGSATGRKQTQR